MLPTQCHVCNVSRTMKKAKANMSFFQSSSTGKMGLFPLQKTEFPMGPARSCGGRRRRQLTSRSPSQIDHLIPAAGEEYSLVPPPVHPVDIDLQPAPQLPPYSLAQKDAAGEPGKTLRPWHAKESARGHRPHYRDVLCTPPSPSNGKPATASIPAWLLWCGASAVAEERVAKTGILTRASRRVQPAQVLTARCSRVPSSQPDPGKPVAWGWCGSSRGAWQSSGSQDAFGLKAVDAQPAGRSPHNHSFHQFQSREKLLAAPALPAQRVVVVSSMPRYVWRFPSRDAAPLVSLSSLDSPRPQAGVRGNPPPASHRPLGPQGTQARKSRGPGSGHR